MTAFPYWIQRADFSTTDREPVDEAHALSVISTHPWQAELNFQAQLESAGAESCSPGIGFVDPRGPFLHVCPSPEDGRAVVHYHAKRFRRILKVFPTYDQSVHTKEDVSQAEVAELIHDFFEGNHDQVLRRLGAA